MINISKSSKNLIIVSFIFSAMVFWLGSRYLSDALTHFSSALSLQRSVVPETTLFEMADSIDQQRSAVQRYLISSQSFSEERSTLSDLSGKTKALFRQAQVNILHAQSGESDTLQHRHGQESMDTLVSALDDKFKRMSITSSVIIRQVYLPLTKRDETIRMKLFDAHSSLIKAVNNIRIRTHGLPDKDYIDVLAAHDKKNAIWNLRESINQSSILLEAYLLKIQHKSIDSLNKENLELRLLQQHERALQALTNLSKMAQKNDVGVSDETVANLSNHYRDQFHLEAEKLLLISPENLDTTLELARWGDISTQTLDQVRLIIDAALTHTNTTADAIRSRAIVDLTVSILIVLFCVLMGFATHRIARRVQHQADFDELTDLPNRRYFRDTLDTLLRKTNTARREKLVLITLDLNGFKAINDTLGHIAGDELLRQVATRLRSVTDDNKIIARMGGDEFAIAYTFGNADADDPWKFATRLRETFTTPFIVDDSRAEVNTSIGYSIYPDDASTINELQKTSDFAMYSAKQSGRQVITPFDRDIADQLEKRMAIERDLPGAIVNNELELYYQPQIILACDEVYSVEALIRWNHPTRGLVPPIDFVCIAEETGIMPALGSWVLNEACRQAAEWNNKDNLSIKVAVNVSVHQLTQPDFVEHVLDAMQRHNLSAGLLELEITESVVMSDIEWIVTSLNTLKSHGVRIALDDFGTGYSSLNQLQALPLDTLKIDRSFISKIDDDTIGMKSITATIASIADIYGLETVAEGIETKQQLAEVRRLGIDVAQGYYYSKPVTKDQVPGVIANIDQQSVFATRKAA
jgi:diguanylate cyclase (GGDEF)-like protein